MALDPTLTALVGAASAVAGAALSSPVIVHILSRRMRRAQTTQVEAQTAQMRAQTDLLRQDLYQQIAGDLQAELTRVKADLETARESLRLTSAEAPRRRPRRHHRRTAPADRRPPRPGADLRHPDHHDLGGSV